MKKEMITTNDSEDILSETSYNLDCEGRNLKMMAGFFQRSSRFLAFTYDINKIYGRKF